METAHCPICTSGQGRFLFVRGPHSYAECSACGLIFQYCPPSAGESRTYYEKNYYDSLAPIMPVLLDARLSIYGNTLAEAPAWKKTGRILDIGCGHGDFLKLAAEAGWEGWGIEPSREAAETAGKIPGLKIFCGTAEEAGFPENHFDIITLWNVVDCLPDPCAALKTIREWLRPGGLLLIRTPNAGFHFSLFRLQQGLKPVLEKIGWKKDASVFLRSNFRPGTLRRFLEENGYANVTVQNGQMTEGDPYQVVPTAGLIPFLKKTILNAAKAVEWITAGRLLMSSVLLAKATKESPEGLPDFSFERKRLKMKQAALHFLALLGYVAGMPLWRRLFGGYEEIRILTYHSIHPRGSDLSVGPVEFEKQIEFLKIRYDILSLEQAADLLERGKLPSRPSVVLTFDDGFRDNYDFLLPAAARNKMPVTIFQITGKERRASYLKGSPLLLRDAEIGEMAANGIHFESHGESHRRLTTLSDEEVLREFKESGEKLKALTGRRPLFFAYPYGRADDFDARILEFARETGYRAACSALYGTNGPEANRYALKRIGIEAADSIFTLRAKLNGALDMLALLDYPPARKALRRLDSFFFQLKSLARTPAEKLEDPVLLVSVDFPPYQNGVSTISGYLSRELSEEKGRNFCVIAPRTAGDAAYDQGRTYQVWRYPGNELGWWRFISVFIYMPYIIFKKKIRKVLAMNVAYGGVIAWLLSFFSRLDYVVFAYGYEFEKFKNITWVHWIYLRIYGRAKAVIPCSLEVGQRLERFGVNEAKIKVVYPAADTSRFFPLEEKKKEEFLAQKNLQGRRIILSAGRLVERKGHDQVLRALGRVLRDFPDVLYLIAGTGPAEEKLRVLTEEFGLQNVARFLGQVADEDLNGYYNACEVFIMPSREIPEEGHVEGFGIVYLEANACAKPVIGGRSGGVVEAIEEGKTGLLADPLSVEDIADKMIFLLSHSEEARKMGAAGLERLHREFSWERYAEIVKQIIR